jgi:hypothetical protein
MYDEARALAPDTARLWQGLLSVYIERADMALVIDLGCGTGRVSELMAAHSVSKWIGVSRDAGYRRRLGEPLKIPFARTRYWRGCPMTISSKGWRHSGPLATQSTRTMPSWRV